MVSAGFQALVQEDHDVLLAVEPGLLGFDVTPLFLPVAHHVPVVHARGAAEGLGLTLLDVDALRVRRLLAGGVQDVNVQLLDLRVVVLRRLAGHLDSAA